jgi:arabinose-5-phosphate isomerase
VVVFVSKSGEAAELVHLLPALKRLGVVLITITARADSPLSKASDCVIDTGEEACPLTWCRLPARRAPSPSGTRGHSVVKLKGFTREDFAFVHPGGVLGRMLNLRVEDVMHSGDAMPRVGEGVSMKDAILEIMNKRLGMTTVVDSRGKLSGVVTTTAHLPKSPDVFKSVGDDDAQPAHNQEATNCGRGGQEDGGNKPSPITSLVVVNLRANRGVIHLHDCAGQRV